LFDTSSPVCGAPFRLSNGSLRFFCTSHKGVKTYLSIADPTISATPVFHSLFLQEVQALASKFPAILGFVQDGNTITVVLGTGGSTVTGPEKIHAYKWKDGDNFFTEIYSNVSITDGAELMENVKCRPDGVLYKWVPGITGLYGDILYADRLGIHYTGNISYPHNVSVGAITYIDGSYYIAAYFLSDKYDTDHKMRMDIIKL
jgi:hypothetical protein